MKSKISDWACAVIVATIAILSLLGTLLLIRALSCVLWSQEAAGWVQAIGSIAAIFGAFEVARQQTRRDRERDTATKAEQRANALLKAVMQGVHIRKVLTEFEKFLTNKVILPNVFKFQEERLAAALRGLEAIPFENLQASDAHSIAKVTIMVVELYSGIASETGAHTAESLKTTIGQFSDSISAEMDHLMNSYKAITGTYPLP